MIPATRSERWLPLALLLADLVGLGAGFVAAYWLRLDRLPLAQEAVPFYGLALLLPAGLYLADTYHPERETKIAGLRPPYRAIAANAVAGILLAAIAYVVGAWGTNPFYGRAVLLGGLALFTLWATAARLSIARWWHAQSLRARWLLVGDPDRTPALAATIQQRYPQATIVTRNPDGEGLPQSCQQAWSGILLAVPSPLPQALAAELAELRLRGIPVYRPIDFSERFLGKITPSDVASEWFLFANGFNLLQNPIQGRIKRLGDLALTVTLLVGLSPLLALTAAAIVLESPGPVFYHQQRTGLHRQPFWAHKFRSMVPNAEQGQQPQWAGAADPRVTRVGRWIRLLRIDELPQLGNVLKGEMSLIGPRPERPAFDRELAAQIPYYNIRYLVKPGITGWAQVLYPYGASVEDAYAKLEYDLYYIKNYSLVLDVAIALKTLRVVLLGKGR